MLIDGEVFKRRHGRSSWSGGSRFVVRYDEIDGGQVGEQVDGEPDSGEATDDLGDDERRRRGRLMPANVSVSVRPMVTAGLANDVDDVNQ